MIDRIKAYPVAAAIIAIAVIIVVGVLVAYEMEALPDSWVGTESVRTN